MTDRQLNFLIDFKKEKKYAPTKSDHIEVSNLIANLKSYSIISKKQNSNLLEITNGYFFNKLIELKSWSEFLNWLDKQNLDSSIVNDFSGSTIGQVNQSSNFSDTPIKIKTNPIPNKNPEKKSLFNIIISNPWFVGISLVILTAFFNADRIMKFINNIINNL